MSVVVEADVKTILTKLDEAQAKAKDRERKLDALVVDLANIRVTQIEFGHIQSRVLERLAEVDKKQDQQAAKQDRADGKLAEHGECLAAMAEWKIGHVQVHKQVDKEVDKAVNRSNWALRLEALTTTITAGFGTIAGLDSNGRIATYARVTICCDS